MGPRGEPFGGPPSKRRGQQRGSCEKAGDMPPAPWLPIRPAVMRAFSPSRGSATVLAQERCSAVVMQSCGCQRPETILVIRVVRGFEHGNAALAVQGDGAQIANRGSPTGRNIDEVMHRVSRHGMRTR